MADVCKEAEWLAALLMTNDRLFAYEMTNLISQKNQFENLAKTWLYSDKQINERLHTINEKIDLFIEAKLLTWQWKYYSIWAEARTKIMQHLSDSWWEVDRILEVMRAVSTTDMINKEALATVMADGNVADADAMIKQFEDSFARYVIAKEKMRINQWVKRELSDVIANIEKKHVNTAAKKWEWILSKTATPKKKLPKWKTAWDAWDVWWTTPKVEQPKLFRRYNWINEIETLTEKEIRDIVYKYFDSDEVTVIFCDNLRTPEWQLALWAYSDWIISFVKAPNKYTPEHEVVHAYIDLCMSDEEKRLLLSYYLQENFPEVRKWMKKNKVDDVMVAAEELIADWFIKYVRHQETFVWKIKWFFEELWYRVKKLFWNEDYVRSLYKDIENKVRRPKIFRWSKIMNETKWKWKSLIDNFSKDFKSPDDVKTFVEDRVWFIERHTNDKISQAYDEEVARTILWYDTNIDWTNLAISYETPVWGTLKFNWALAFYNQSNHSVVIWNGKRTVPHEMTHALDWVFYQELFWVRESIPLSKWVFSNDRIFLTWERKALAEEFLWIMESVINDDKQLSLLRKMANKMNWKARNEYASSVRERYARFWEAFIHNLENWKRVSGYWEHFSQELFDRYSTWLSHMADARARWVLYNPNWLTRQSWNQVMFKRAETEASSKITTQKIKADPVLRNEYLARIDAVKAIQQLNAKDIDTLKNFWGFFAENWLFWTALVKDLWDEIIEIASRYLKKWEDINTMTVADVRKRMLDFQSSVRNANKKNNIMAQMEADRDSWAIKADFYKLENVMSESWVPLKVDWRITKEWLNYLFRWEIDENFGMNKALDEASISSASRVDTSKKWWSKKWWSKKWWIEKPQWETTKQEQIAESWAELEKRWNEKVNTEQDIKKGEVDPMEKTELSPEAEQVLKENIEKDIEQVLKWESPSNVADADEIWQQFYSKTDDIKERELLLNNFILWKIMLWEWEDALESALKRLDWKNLDDFWPLTMAQIAKISDLWQLEQVVYSHMWDLVYDRALRQAMKDKQYELWTTASTDDAAGKATVLSKSRSMQKTAEFLEAWGEYTNVSLYDRVWNSLKRIFPEINKTINNRDLYDEFVTAVTNFSSKRKTDTVKVWWMDMTANDLVKWIYVISWDDLVKDVASLKADPTDQLKVAAKKLFDIWDEKDAEQAQKRIDDLFNSITPQELTNADVTKMAYVTTSDVAIDWEITESNAVFYNYRDWMYAWDPQTTYWEFFDEIAKQNSLIVDSEHKLKEAFKISEIPADVKYIIVNDFNRRDDSELYNFLYSLPKEKQPKVIYPRWYQAWNYYMENWKLKFKTTDALLYNEITRDTSAKTLWAFAQSMEEVTEESAKNLEEKALEYFRTIMWLDMKWAPENKAEYKAWIINNLRVMTWLPISSEMDIYNPQSTWKMANDIIRYQLWATWKYTKVIKNASDVISEATMKFNNDRQWFFNEIKAIVWWSDEIMEKNADAIRDAYINYLTAQTIDAKITNKWLLMALCNWWEFANITVDTFNTALRNDDFISVLWPIIYWEREYTDSEISALNKLWDDILSAYIFDLWSNLVRDQYYLPLVSPAQTIRKLLRWENIMNDDFTQAFIKKNWLQENSELIGSILRNALPDELDIPLPTELLLNKWIETSDVIVDEVPNVIIPTNYNQLMAVIKKWKTSKWWWVTWEEEAIIWWILDSYYKAVSDAIEAWTMTPTLAQQLKLQAWWALDRAEQDLIFSKYDSFLTAWERNWLMWGKYKLRIATTKEELESVKRWNQEILNWYRRQLWDMWETWMKVYWNMDAAKKDLIEKWKILANIDWKIVTVNVHDMLIQQLETLPDWVRWIFKNFENLTANDIRWIPFKEAYAMVKAIDLAKNATARWNLYARLMYKQNPQLANIDFFRRYALNSDWIPRALQRNAARLVDATISDSLDLTMKQNIMLDISQIMKNKWRLTEEELEDIVDKNISWFGKDDTIKNHYTNMFKAYTYLTDIPKDIKNTINQMLDVQLKEIRNEISWMDNDFFEWLLNTRVTLLDWSDVTIRDLISWDIDAYKADMFIEKWKDGVYRPVDMKESTAAELWLTETQKLEYSDAMYSMLNSLDQVDDVQRKLNTVILWDARQILNKYTTTKKLIDADYLIWGQNDLLRNLIRSNAFSNWWQLWWDQDLISKAWWKATWRSFFNKENWNAIKEYYYSYYRQSLDVLEKTKVSNDLQATALEMARYFKRIENTLGSADWVVWASVNSALNRAFWRLWTIILNVNTSSQVHSLMQAISNNQILAFFKFAKEWDWAFFKWLSDMEISKLKGVWTEYVRQVEMDDVKRFNELFNTNFSRWEYVIIMQALWWYKIWWQFRQWINWLMRWVNFSSSLLRAAMSYPFQLFTIAPQSIAYNLKANWYKRALWIEDMSKVTDTREFYDILTSDYVELNPIWRTKSQIKNALSKYTWKEVSDLMKAENVEMDDSIIDLFWKSYSHATKNYKWQQFLQLLDATRDNANNIVDALMAQKFKNLAFVKALKYNNVMPFNNADAFKRFMDDVNIPQELKDKVLDSVKIYSWRIFKDMLWTWFSWLDKMYWANIVQDILIWLMNTINFRWARWLNMFRQTIWKIWSTAKILRFIWDRKAIWQAVEYIKRTPEFSDLTQAMFNDLVWMWKLWRYSDNGKVPTDESEVDFMDFCERVVDNIDIVSQQWQWIMSFWPARPFIAQWEAIFDHLQHPDQYWDPYWVWAFINTLVSNVWRNWKPVTFVIKALRAAQADWDMNRAWAYASDHWYELSAWTLRYMLEEWYNDYWSNTPLVYELWWIPSFIAWEQWAGSDTAYLYKMRSAETWEYIKWIREWKDWYSAWWLFTSLMWSSQFMNAIKEGYWLYKYSTADTDEEKNKYRSTKSTYWLEDMDKEYADVPEWNEWRTTWFIKPKREDKYMKYYDDIISIFTEWTNPWGAKFEKWLRNFLDYWHVNWEEEWSYYDRVLEEFYTRIQEKDPNAIKDILRNDTLLTQIATEDTAWAIQTELSWAMKWLQEFDWDPEYNKYAAMVYKWVMSNVMYNELQAFADEKTKEYQAAWKFTKKKDKWSATNIKDTIYYDDFKQDFVENHWDDLMVADVEWMQTAMFNHLARVSKEATDKFFVEKTFENDDWTKTTKWYLKSNLRTQIKQLTDFEAAMDAWEWERAVVDWTALTKTFSYDHPVSTQVAISIFNRIDASDTLTEKEKLEAKAEFVANNLDAFAWDSEFASENPELYEEAKWYYNEINYQVNQEMINAANDYALSLNSDKEDSKGKWWWGWLALKLNSIFDALRKNQQNTGWWRSWNWNWNTMTWVKAPILDPTKVFIEDSKAPKVNFNPKFTSRPYTPKTDLWWGSKQQPTAKPVKVKKVKVKEKDIEVI